MILYLIATPSNKLDLKARASGWRFIPLEKKAKADWRGLLSPLREKGVSHVYASDLDQEAAHAAGDELHVPVRTEFYFRRFNVGKHHGAKLDYLDTILDGLAGRWRSNPDIPIAEGDSLSSYRKRFVRAFNALLDKEGAALLVTDSRTIATIRGEFTTSSFVPNGNAVKAGKIFKVEKVSNGRAS
jgi:broad specificity phosphatase PhoE